MKPRQDYVYAQACGFIAAQGICNLPVNPFEIIQRNRWGIATYQRLGVLTNAAGNFEPLLGRSRDGFTIYNGRNYCIAYNDAVGSFCRIVFTLMHEIGHIWLRHFIDFTEEELSALGRELEEEASPFASYALAPSVVIRRCGLRSPALLQSACGMSAQAASRRLAQFRTWHETQEDKPVEKLFDAYCKVNIARRARLDAADIRYDDDAQASRLKQLPG
jgi:Zn-dependent peptidase ImmA (M78 family)